MLHQDDRKFLTEAVVDFIVIFTFLKKLTTPFKNWPAYELGIIDEKGTVLKKRATLSTPQEKRAFTLFDVLILNIKKIIEKIPGGKSRLATFIAALYLIKEEKNSDLPLSEDMIYESFMDFYDLIKSDPQLKKQVENLMKKSNWDIEEDAPANSVAAGGVAGLTEPIVRKTPITIYKRKKFKDFVQ